MTRVYLQNLSCHSLIVVIRIFVSVFYRTTIHILLNDRFYDQIIMTCHKCKSVECTKYAYALPVKLEAQLHIHLLLTSPQSGKNDAQSKVGRKFILEGYVFNLKCSIVFFVLLEQYIKGINKLMSLKLTAKSFYSYFYNIQKSHLLHFEPL